MSPLHPLRIFLLLVALGLGACTTSGGEKCPKGTHPCGNGCMPQDAVCCDNGSAHTSSYCTNAATGGCYPNNRGCPAAFPGGATAEFCCGNSGNVGSNDCPKGQRHCGLLCKPVGEPCCPKGSSDEDCPQAGWDPSGCGYTNPSDVGCAVCLNTQQCISCPSGSCCRGDPCGSGGCVTGAACTGGGGGGGGGSCGLPSTCSAHSDCSGFGSRNCAGGAAEARCGGDGLCHCCLEVCSGSSCQCSSCVSCSGDRMCVDNICVFKVGGKPCD